MFELAPDINTRYHKTTSDTHIALKFPIQVITAAVLFMVVGVYFMAAGFPLFTVTMGMVGFVLGASVTWISLRTAEPVHGYPMASTVYLCACVGAGLFFGLATSYFWKLSLYLLCCVTGYMFSLFVWCWRDDFIIRYTLTRHLVSLSITLVFTLSVVVIEFIAVIVSMSFIGAYLFVLGLDVFVQTGFSKGIEDILTFRPYYKTTYHIDLRVYGMLCSVLGLWIIASVWQMCFNRGKRFGLHVVKNSNDTLKV
ncbi:hypothetical protein RMATCC62417_02451 [Rhizopus microsporus]|nr:hypothetical protein RMATCC62417_02451 [Rhizopus microsporus]